MTKFRELPSAIVGQLGEQIVAREYRRDGWGAIASYKFSGANDNEAPAIEIDDGDREITPDLDISKGGRRVWIEVKTHAIAAPNGALSRKFGREIKTHGIPVRLYDNYAAVESRSGNPVYLAVVQLDTREILVSPRPLHDMVKFECLCGCRSLLTNRCTAGQPTPRRYPQWYFNREDFEVRGHVDERAFRLLDERHREMKRLHVIRKHVDREGAADRTFAVKPPWTWACLVCDITGVGDSSAHRCENAAEYRREFWIWRLRRAMPNVAIADIASIVNRPIERTRIAELLGVNWQPDGAAR